MKIVQINAVYAYSSTGRTTRELHEFLLSKGEESYVFCSRSPVEEKNVFLIGNEFDHRLHSLGSHLSGRQEHFSYFATLCLLKQLYSIQPDIVILRNLHNNYINLPLLLSWLASNNIHTVIVLHDCWFFTGHCCYYTEDNCMKWMSECNNCPTKHKYNKSLFFDKSRSSFYEKKRLLGKIKSLTVIGVSDWVTNEAKKSPLFSQAIKIQRIYNWIDHSVFYPMDASSLREKLCLSSDDFVVLGVAQKWTSFKGLTQFVMLAINVPDIKVVLVGDATVANSPSNLILYGSTTDINELAKLYSMADVFVNYSCQETFGKVTAEALSCGTPVISNRSTANPELCGDGCGYVVESTDWQEVLQYITLVKQNGKDSYTNKCFEFSRAMFDKKSGLNSYINLFEEINKVINEE